MNTKDTILNHLKEHYKVTPKQLGNAVGISRQALYVHLKVLIKDEKITKIGTPPKVYYALQEELKPPKTDNHLPSEDIHLLDSRFYQVTPLGVEKSGVEGFEYWCGKQNLNVQKTAKEYRKTLVKYDAYKKEGVINGNEKIHSTFDKVWMDDLFYLDFYAIERFGKTKLGYYLLYAKQGQAYNYIENLIALIKPQIEMLVKKYKIDGIAFAPATIKREYQLMKIIEETCNCGIRTLQIHKAKTPILIPQKTLSKLPDRIENARNTMVVTETSVFNNILLIDDAVGSGATLNEISAQIKKKNLCKGRLICLAITGSFNGFDVISEV